MSSHDQSTDSVASSVQRSGLAMTIGDTKSIVLALQSLQEKIRKLEQDRNFHQEQCEKAHQAHEAYKIDVEMKLESERSHHRQREQELQDLLARANAERQRLQSALEESKQDLGTFRSELEQLLETERSNANEREERFRLELESYRKEISHEKSSNERLTQTVEQLRAERDVIQTTNRRLESTIRDLISVGGGETKKRRASLSIMNAGASALATQQKPSTATYRDAHNLSVGSARGRSLSNDRRPPMHYQNPTYSSVVRDVRVDHVTRPPTPPRHPSPRSFQSTTAAPAQASGRGGAAKLNQSVEHLRAIDEVTAELQQEHRSLHQKYKDLVERAATDNIPPEVLTASLNSLVSQIDKKAEQIRLIRNTRSEIAETAGAGPIDVPAAPILPARSTGPGKSSSKSSQRNAIVNELRALFSKAGV